MKHGTSGYQRFKCRCEICVKANSANKRRYRESRPAAYPPHRSVRQWPLQPLLDSVPDCRALIGVEWTSWDRAVKHGLSDRTADQWAIRCGVHPGEVWGDWFVRGLAPGDDIFINGCEDALPGWRRAYVYEQPYEQGGSVSGNRDVPGAALTARAPAGTRRRFAT